LRYLFRSCISPSDIKVVPSSKEKTVRTMTLGEEPPEDQCLKLIKEKKSLIHYQDGYRKGFHERYVDARKKLSKKINNHVSEF
jgi:hypothetical protein